MSLRPRAALAVVALPTDVRAAAQSFPAGPLRRVVPFTPGCLVDTRSRAIGRMRTDASGEQVVVENRGGAGGGIGGEHVARAEADRRTLLTGHVGTHAIDPALHPSPGHDPVRDLADRDAAARLGGASLGAGEARTRSPGAWPRTSARRSRHRTCASRSLPPGVALAAGMPEDFAAPIRREIPRRAVVVKASGVKAD